MKNLLPHGQGTRIIAVANQKGGVGKTTTAINLGTALAAINQKVLLLDLDPQGNASTGLGVERGEREINTYQVLIGAAGLLDATQTTNIPNLDIVPSGPEFRLREALAQSLGAYDYVLIDCPPSLDLLTVNALATAQAVLVPLQCEFYALEGVSQLIRTIENVRKAFNPKLEIQGIVLTMHDSRNNLSSIVAADVRSYFGDKVYNTIIPRNVRVSEAPSHGMPVLIYDITSAGAQAYLALAGEIIHRERHMGAT